LNRHIRNSVVSVRTTATCTATFLAVSTATVGFQISSLQP